MSGGPGDPTSIRSKSVLIVDDEEDIRDALRDLLEVSLELHHVRTAPSALEAKRLLAEERADLILTDYRMPGQNGLDFLESLDPEDKAARVLLTAYPEVELAERASGSARVEAFIAKPAEPEEVIDIVSRILHGSWTVEDRRQRKDRVLRELRSSTGG